MSLCSVEIHRHNDGLRARCIKVVEEERGGAEKEREGEGRKIQNAKTYQALCWNIHKCDIIFTMKETMLNAENHVG